MELWKSSNLFLQLQDAAIYIYLTLPDAHFDLRGIESFDVGPQVAVEDVHQNRLEHHLCYQFRLYSVSTVCNVPESER